VQVMRVLLIVLGLPAGLALFGSAVGLSSLRGVTEPSLAELALLIVVSAIARHCDATDSDFQAV